MTVPLRSDPNFPRLKDYLIQATGLAYYGDKDDELAHRVSERLTARGLKDCESYLALLTGAPEGAAELDRAIRGLTNGETFFFRHRELFDALRDVALPEIIARNSGPRRLRVWSAGCSVGAEPYSVAILLRRDFGAALAGWDVRVLGTDINREFLARARAGWFEEWALRGLPEDARRDCFTPSGSGWAIRPEFAERVTFEYHNLVAREFLSRADDLPDFDLILCRNVTIYFGPDTVRRIVGRFHQNLATGGWLGVGHAEPNVALFRAFRTVNAPGAVLYQKVERAEEGSDGAFGRAARTPPAEPSAPLPVTHAAPPLPPVPVAAPAAAPTLDEVRALADRGAWGGAARACESLLADDGLNTAAHFYRGLVLEHAGRHADAEGALRRAIYLDRGHVLAHCYLALFLQRWGRLPEAARAFRNALQLLRRLPGEAVLAEGDGITAGELAKFIERHAEASDGG